MLAHNNLSSFKSILNSVINSRNKNESTIQKSILIRAQVFHDGVSRQSKINRTYKTDYDGHLGTTKRIQGITYALLSKYNILGIMRAIDGSISGLFYMLVKLKFVSLYVWKESPLSLHFRLTKEVEVLSIALLQLSGYAGRICLFFFNHSNTFYSYYVCCLSFELTCSSLPQQNSTGKQFKTSATSLLAMFLSCT